MDLSSLQVNSRKQYTARLLQNLVIEEFSSIHSINKWQWRLKFKQLFNHIKNENYNFIYIRYTHFSNPFFIRFLRNVKEQNIPILLEIPTFPYDQEYINIGLKHKLLLQLEKRSRTKFRKYVDRIVTFSDYTKIFGVQTINISNGVNLQQINLVPEQDGNPNKFNLIGVASMNFWHGFDRLIEGMRNYYNESINKKEVYFHIVGDTKSSEALRYIALSKKYNLQKFVIFHDKQFGKGLDNIFAEAHLGVGCLGCHRKGIKFIKSIKNREYCARGIPFLFSETDLDFEDKRFILKAPSDESPVNIDEIIFFLEQNDFDRNEIRKFAVHNLSWDSQITKVVTELKFLLNKN